MEKICSRCRIPQLVDENFPRSRRSADGFNALCYACSSIKAKEVRQRRKWRVLSHYSEGSMSCKCCGESRYEFLTLDHELGGGNIHRASVGDVYTWALKEGFPQGFRVLCMNCNSSFGLYGYCPHNGGSKVIIPPLSRPVIRSIGLDKARLVKRMLLTMSASAVHRATGVSRSTVQLIKHGRAWSEA